MSALRRNGLLCLLLAFLLCGIFLITAQEADAAIITDLRLAGQDRFETSFAIAEQLYRAKGSPFDNMTVASGMNYPDALSACYLTYEKGTPLLLVGPRSEELVLQRVRRYTKRGGTVYLIGGPGSISENFEKMVKGAGYEAVRLAATDRFGTNLEILSNVVAPERELLVASGLNYPDSLSASAVPKPLLLVGNDLTPEQKSFLKQAGITKIYILGGTGSVNARIETQLKAFCPVIERIGGQNRYETSYLIAMRFHKPSSTVTIASGTNFPDGLSGGPLAMAAEASLLLVADHNTDYARSFILAAYSIRNNVIFGGPGSVSAECVKAMLSSKPQQGEAAWLAQDWGPNVYPENVVYFNDLREKGNVIGHSSGVRVELAYATSDDGKPGAKVRLTNMTEATRRYMCGFSTYNDDLVTMINMALPNMPIMLGPGESTEAFINQSSFTAFSMQVRIVD